MSKLARENFEFKQELKQQIDGIYIFISSMAALCLGVTIIKIIEALM